MQNVLQLDPAGRAATSAWAQCTAPAHNVAHGLDGAGHALRGARAGGRPRKPRGGNQLRRAQTVADVGVEIRNGAGAHHGGELRLEGGQREALRERHRLYKKNEGIQVDARCGCSRECETNL